MNDMSAVRIAPPPLIMLVILSAIQPIALNIIAPSTPAIARDLGSDYATVQLNLTFFLAAVAVSQLITGPWSDRSGRRPVIIFSLATFFAGCVAAVFATSVETLIAARVIQAIGSGAAFALARAIIRDTSTREEAASRIGYMMVAMLIAPMLSPTIGSLIDRFAGWHAIFVALAAVAAGAGAMVWRGLPETNLTRDPHASFAKVARAFPILLRSNAFLGYTLAVAATSALFFSYVAGAPHVVVVSMGQEPQVYAAWFVLMSLGYAIGNYISGRYSLRMNGDLMIALGAALTLAACLVQAWWAWMIAWSPAALFVPGFFMALGNGATIPSAMAGALSVRPDLAGSASGLAGALQLGVAAISSIIAGHVAMAAPRGIVVIHLVSAVFGLLVLLLLTRRAGRS